MTPKEAIIATVAAWGAGDPAALIRIAERESRLNPTARGDLEAAPRAYERVRDNLQKMGNPWANDPSRWDASMGLFQMMPAYYARLWSPTADPHVLYDPRIATVIAGRLWNRAVKAGADDFVSVRLFWANPNWVRVPDDDERYISRLNDKWSIVDGEVNPSVIRFRGYSAFGTGPQEDQEERLPRAAIPDDQPNWLRIASIALLGYRLWKSYGK